MKMKVFDDGFEGHVRRSLARAKARQAGERLEPETAIAFADPLDMLECLSRQRIRIVQTIRMRKLSISPLAEELDLPLTLNMLWANMISESPHIPNLCRVRMLHS
jgi:hypothetical protein